MKKQILLLLLAATLGRAATPDVLTVAVFDFESKDAAVHLGPKVAALINASLSAEPQVITVERAELDKALGEQELGLSGTVSTESAAKVGQLTGAKVLITGRVFKVDDETVLVAKIIGTENGRVYGEMVKGTSAASITGLSDDLAKKITATLSGKGDTLIAKVEGEERIANIKKTLQGKTLPLVSIKVDERHFGNQVIDPAAETEWGKLLQECGFTLVDAKSTNHAAVEITGEAFSAYGLRKGNLISCKSRIEIKVRDVASGNLIAVDRQTSVGVDIAEQTAAKTALENATDELAASIPKLAK